MQTYRMIYGYNSIWRGAHGANPWDYNATEPDGTHIDGHPPYLFESGTVTATSDSPGIYNSLTAPASKIGLPVSGLITISEGHQTDITWLITDNTNNTLNIRQWGDGCCLEIWNIGDSYEIHKCLAAVDQPGLGAGD